MAGPGSAGTFRRNFCLRLAEALCNLEWLHDKDPHRFNPAELRMYHRFYQDLSVLPFERSWVLEEIHARIRNRFAGLLDERTTE